MADLTTRQQAALVGNWGDAPRWFKHSEPPGKPALPSIGKLGAIDAASVRKYLALRNSGTITSLDTAAFSPAAQAAIAQLDTFFATPAWMYWAALNIASRDSQWRLYRADVHLQTQFPGSSVVPISADPLGIGSNNAVVTAPATNPQQWASFEAHNLNIDSASTNTNLAAVAQNVNFYLTKLAISLYLPSATSQFLFLIFHQLSDFTDTHIFSDVFLSDSSDQKECPRYETTFNPPIPIPGNSIASPTREIVLSTARKSVGSTGALASINLLGFTG